MYQARPTLNCSFCFYKKEIDGFVFQIRFVPRIVPDKSSAIPSMIAHKGIERLVGVFIQLPCFPVNKSQKRYISSLSPVKYR